MVVYYIKAWSYRWFMVNIFAVDNFQPGDLQLIIFNQYSSVDDSQHCGVISNIQLNLLIGLKRLKM